MLTLNLYLKDFTLTRLNFWRMCISKSSLKGYPSQANVRPLHFTKLAWAASARVGKTKCVTTHWTSDQQLICIDLNFKRHAASWGSPCLVAFYSSGHCSQAKTSKISDITALFTTAEQLTSCHVMGVWEFKYQSDRECSYKVFTWPQQQADGEAAEAACGVVNMSELVNTYSS